MAAKKTSSSKAKSPKTTRAKTAAAKGGWSATKGFLSALWPELVDKQPVRPGDPLLAKILGRYDVYGYSAPASVGELLSPLDGREPPPLFDFVPGSYAPAATTSRSPSVE